MKSVLQDWVTELPLMQQAVLVSALRGADGVEKNNAAKTLIRFIRGTVLNAAKPDFIAEGRIDVFMIDSPSMYNAGDYFDQASWEFLTNFDHYPIHFILHLLHAVEVIGYKHPPMIEGTRGKAYCYLKLYCEMCKALHVGTESEDELDERLHS